MTVRSKKFTPEVMLSAPRRSPATPSPDGKLALYTQSTYSFESHTKTSEICVLDIAHGTSTCLTKDVKASEPKWLGQDYEVAWLKEGENGNTSFVVSDAGSPGKSYTAGTVAGTVSNLKVLALSPGIIAVAVSGQADRDGGLHNPKDVPKSHSSARLYDSLFVRHWDTYVTSQRNTIFTALLQKAQSHVTSRQGRYNLVGFSNALQGTNLECPIPPFGGTDHFDIGVSGLVFVAKDPRLDPATHTTCHAYYLPPADLVSLAPPQPRMLEAPGLDGAASSPVFSPDGSAIAFLQMQIDGYESDANRLVLVQNFAQAEYTAVDLTATQNGEQDWDRSPSAVMWSFDGRSLYVQAEDVGRGCLFAIDLSQSPVARWPPRRIETTGYIVDVAPASATSPLLFVSSNSLIDNSVYTLVDPSSTPNATQVVSSLTNDGSNFGLTRGQVSEVCWDGANDHRVHAWMVRPSFFRKDHKYPLAYLIHGGPQGAWMDQWSTRWNPAVFAEQGYVVICPNPTGSTGYGQAFTDAIRNEWGGLPYEDLVKGFDYIERELSDFVDTSRAVALGASYGGYMMNWMQGHELGRKFQALVCHDGVFSMTSQLASDEQYFPIHDMGGPIWKRQDIYDKWDPARFLAHWQTPMLVIHNELDYRLTIAEGLAAFNVLQMKGIESRFLSFPDENHWVLKYENSLVWHLVVINWINSYVGLPKLVDKNGRDGSEFCRQARRSGGGRPLLQI